MNRRPGAIRSDVRVQMARFTGTSDGWSLRIEDDASGMLLLDATFTFEEFARVLGGMVTVPASIFQSDKVGRKMYVARARVPFPVWARSATGDSWVRFLQDATAMYKSVHPDEFVPPGEWLPDIEVTFNPHRLNDDGYEVIFRCWPEPEPEP